MSSSFRLAGQSRGGGGDVSVRGTKGWLYGLRLTSLGHKGVDTAVGGGVALGSVTICHTTGFQAAAHGSAFASLFCAQALATGQRLCVVGTNAEEVLAGLPFHLTSSSSSSSHSSSYCSSYDFARRTVTKRDDHQTAYTPSFRSASPLTDALRHIEGLVEAQSSDSPVLRLCVLDPVGPEWGTAADTVRFLTLLRTRLRGTRVVAYVTLPPGVLPSDAETRVLHTAHLAFTVEAFADGPKSAHPPEFEDWHGLFTIRRLPRLHSLAPLSSADTLVYLVKRDAHKIKFEKPHLPPEHSRSTGGAGADSAPSSTAPAVSIGAGVGVGSGSTKPSRSPALQLGMACMGGSVDQSNPLDF